jgi:outer membrane protein assembly factor BamB
MVLAREVFEVEVKDARGAHMRPHRLARLVGIGALVLVILACGGTLPPEMIPVATLEPGAFPFRVVSLAGDVLQARAGHDGKLQWETHVGAVGNALLTADAHVVYISDSSTPMVIALSADNGRILWQFSACTGPDHRILLGQGRLYLTCGQATQAGPDDISLATLYALDAHTGAVLWTVAQQHAQAIAGPNVIAQTTTGVASLNGATGAVLWRHQVAIGPVVPVPPLDAFQFVVRVGPAGLYYAPDGMHAEALRTSDGAHLWSSGPVQDLASAPNDSFVQHAYIALATADEIVTQGIYGVTVLRVSDGTPLWHYYQYPNGSGITTLVGDDGTVYIAKYYGPSVATPAPENINPLAALNPRDGSLRWDVNGPFANHPLMLLDGEMLITSQPYYISAFGTADGTRRWQQKGIFATYLTADAQVVCAQAGSLLYVLKVADGLKVWKQPLPGSGQAAPLLLPA